MIEIKNLYKKYDKPVLENINLKIEDGSILGLVGINGAGKTTLLSILAGIMKEDEGEVLFDGKKVFENVGTKNDIFLLPDDPFYTRNTTPKSLVNVYKVFYDIALDDYFRYLNDFNLPLDKTMLNFSKGMRRQVFIALALAIKPKYLFLDEAFDGIDPVTRAKVKKELLRVQDETNMTVIISSHSLRELRDICDSFCLIDHLSIKEYGELNEYLTKYHKYNMAFNERYLERNFDIDFISFRWGDKILSCVCELDYENMKKAIEKLNPIILEEVPIDFEELFLIEVEGRRYLEK
ncbi:MAG: ABC transporter ATP-binding protein [Acholeplasmatales bacterium]|nr:ABC transporter ATP-binding protein [Acholeplasmatales bacterium]